MNYIKRLEEEVAVLREQAAVAYVEIEDLFEYLDQPKFTHGDTTVQVQDDAYCEARGGR